MRSAQRSPACWRVHWPAAALPRRWVRSLAILVCSASLAATNHASMNCMKLSASILLWRMCGSRSSRAAACCTPRRRRCTQCKSNTVSGRAPSPASAWALTSVLWRSMATASGQRPWPRNTACHPRRRSPSKKSLKARAFSKAKRCKIRSFCGLARSVEIYADAEIEAIYPRYGTVAEVRLKYGCKLDTKLFDAQDAPADPCSAEEGKVNFRCLATVTNSKAMIADGVGRLEKRPDVRSLSEALRSGVSAS